MLTDILTLLGIIGIALYFGVTLFLQRSYYEDKE